MGFGRKPAKHRECRPAMESLEGRVVPTVFHANNVNELVADISAVNNSPGVNTIILAHRSYDLPGVLRVQNAGSLTIQGSTTGSSTLYGSPGNRVFEFDGGTVTLQNVAVSNGGGVAQGGGIYAAGTNLTIRNSTISANTATVMGGGLFVDGGSLTMTGSLVDSNAVGGPGPCSGGGLAALNATVTLMNTNVNNNIVANANRSDPAEALDIGGGIFTQGGTLSVTRGAVSGNSAIAATTGASAASIGAGIATSDTTATINGTIFDKNTLSTVASVLPDTLGSATATTGGSLTIKNATFSKNTPARSQEFYQANTTVTLQNSTVDGKKFAGRFLLTPRGFVPQH